MYNKDIKFSLWCDFLERDFIENELVELIQSGIINGATSNPSIFKNAILNSPAYVSEIGKFGKKEPKDMYEILATQDIRVAAGKFFKNYVNGDDGFVSIEVDPMLSTKEEATIKEGRSLYSTIGMPNVMIKIPATNDGYGAMSELLKRGININATLVFTPQQTKKCLAAFEDGISGFKKRFPKANLPHAVVSIFVSRFDRVLDEKLEKHDRAKVGILNATKCYHIVQKANLPSVKALFASTGVKGDKLEKDYYIKELLFANSINTAPLETIKEFIKSTHKPKQPASIEEIDKFFTRLNSEGIDIKEVGESLLEDGLRQFEDAFGDILEALK